jgi:GNAT superfamily N-acetyltransferase
MEHSVTATVEDIRKALFEYRDAHAAIAEEDGVRVGFALYFYNFSTFLENADYIWRICLSNREYRHKGYGRRSSLPCGVAVERGADASSGRVWTGTNLPSVSIRVLGSSS